MEISLDAEKLAHLLMAYADDWVEALNFVVDMANAHGLDVDVDTVSSIIKKEYAEDEQ